MSILLLGMADVAELLKVRYETVQKWRTRGLLPDPNAYVGRIPIWLRDDVLLWAASTKRYSRHAPRSSNRRTITKWPGRS